MRAELLKMRYLPFPRWTGAILVIVVTAVAGVLIAAAAGGLSHLAANRAGVPIDDGDLAGDLFGSVPTWVSGAVIGYGFGLLGRSLGGGIAASFVFVLAFDGLVSLIPGAQDYTYGTSTTTSPRAAVAKLAYRAPRPRQDRQTVTGAGDRA
jgi:hypothetical protein